MSESDEKDDVEPDEPKGKINDPLTQKGREAPRMSWQGQKPVPDAPTQEGDETGDQ